MADSAVASWIPAKTQHCPAKCLPRIPGLGYPVPPRNASTTDCFRCRTMRIPARRWTFEPSVAGGIFFPKPARLPERPAKACRDATGKRKNSRSVSPRKLDVPFSSGPRPRYRGPIREYPVKSLAAAIFQALEKGGFRGRSPVL